MANIIPWNNNNQSSGNGNNGTADSLRQASQENSIVSTAKPIRWKVYSDAEVESAKKDLESHKKAVKNFDKIVQLNLQHQAADTAATASLVKWRVGTTQQLGAKYMAVAAGASQQAMIQAQVGGQMQLIGAKTDAAIEKINQKIEEKKKQLKSRR